MVHAESQVNSITLLLFCNTSREASSRQREDKVGKMSFFISRCVWHCSRQYDVLISIFPTINDYEQVNIPCPKSPEKSVSHKARGIV
jgi:hypothetical protein